MKDKDFDVKAFPCLHPTGRFGLNHAREFKITPQMYFTQRLLNQNQIFAKSIPYLFMAHQFVEREMLQKQINVSGYKYNDDLVCAWSGLQSLRAHLRNH